MHLVVSVCLSVLVNHLTFDLDIKRRTLPVLDICVHVCYQGAYANNIADAVNWLLIFMHNCFSLQFQAYGLKPEVWGRVGPDPWAELQVDPARGPQALGLGRPKLRDTRANCVSLGMSVTRTGERSFV